MQTSPARLLSQRAPGPGPGARGGGAQLLLVHAAPGDPVRDHRRRQRRHEPTELMAAAAHAVRPRQAAAGAAGRLSRQGAQRRSRLLVLLQPAGAGADRRSACRPRCCWCVSSVLLAVRDRHHAGRARRSRGRTACSRRSITVLSLVGFAAPVFWTGIMLVILFGSGVADHADLRHARRSIPSGGGFARRARRAAPPGAAVADAGLVYLAQYSRLSRVSMLDVLGCGLHPHRARQGPGRARGASYKHALRNALLPVVTVLGLQFGNLIAGAVLVETVFNWPGLGRLAFDSMLRRDYPTMLGVLFFSSIVVIVVNIVTDLAYRLIDPRIRRGPDEHDRPPPLPTVAGRAAAAKAVSPTVEALRMFLRNPSAIAGRCCCVLIAAGDRCSGRGCTRPTRFDIAGRAVHAALHRRRLARHRLSRPRRARRADLRRPRHAAGRRGRGAALGHHRRHRRRAGRLLRRLGRQRC